MRLDAFDSALSKCVMCVKPLLISTNDAYSYSKQKWTRPIYSNSILWGEENAGDGSESRG